MDHPSKLLSTTIRNVPSDDIRSQAVHPKIQSRPLVGTLARSAPLVACHAAVQHIAHRASQCRAVANGRGHGRLFVNSSLQVVSFLALGTCSSVQHSLERCWLLGWLLACARGRGWPSPMSTADDSEVVSYYADRRPVTYITARINTLHGHHVPRPRPIPSSAITLLLFLRVHTVTTKTLTRQQRQNRDIDTVESKIPNTPSSQASITRNHTPPPPPRFCICIFFVSPTLPIIPSLPSILASAPKFSSFRADRECLYYIRRLTVATTC
ncbi:hypothetical protein B0J13DRAFT_519393 [Dactylonectria estremocensis]|uniref:Uncharacterized protein n=1 Tax=Dactylonectria estremocensis TaxID=1079267 RepID=A0A9P9FDS8_9HYPO|nr:hypothetical protein B0J13DRAFT_519393 [Dactylonectria estremocensis]